jgi:hypothetical protein
MPPKLQPLTFVSDDDNIFSAKYPPLKQTLKNISEKQNCSFKKETGTKLNDLVAKRENSARRILE